MHLLALTLLGCGRQPLPPNPDSPPFEDLQLDGAMYGFSWVDARSLAAMPRPNTDDLHWMGSEGIEVLVSLTVSPLDPALIESAGLESVHIPVRDFRAPSQDQIDTFTALVDSERSHGRSLGVHCLAGLGRSGTMAASWFIHEGMTAPQAIQHVRTLRPGSIETDEQLESLHRYATRLRQLD